jgi:AcrR family transcriptional regulator
MRSTALRPWDVVTSEGIYACKYLLANMSPGPSPRRRGAQDARTRILGAGLDLFGDRGFKATTTRDIAERAKVNEVTIFRQFGSKRNLFAAVMAEMFPVEEIRQSVSLETDGDIEELLFSNVKIVLGILRGNESLFKVVLAEIWRMPKARGMAAEFGFERGVRLLSEFMEAQMDAGRFRRMDPEIAARAWLGMIQSYFMARDLFCGARSKELDEDEVLRGFVRIFTDGMRECV